MAQAAIGRRARPLRQALGRDDKLSRLALGILGLWLVVTVLLPLWALLSKAFQNRDGGFVGLANFRHYLETPTLAASIGNSLLIATISTVDLHRAGLPVSPTASPAPACRAAGCSGSSRRSRSSPRRCCRRSASSTCSATRAWPRVP